MRTIATLLLVVMTLVFVATSFAQARWQWLAYVRAFAEAGMVGACADWFAVVALFRRPLGLPIPHTGIVPRNKARIAGALGRFITNNFLTPKVLSEKLVQVDAAQWIADWLGNPDNARGVARRAAVVVPEVVRALPRDLMADSIGRSLVAGLKAVPAGPVAGNLLAIVWAQGQTQKVLERAIAYRGNRAARQQGFHPLQGRGELVALGAALARRDRRRQDRHDGGGAPSRRCAIPRIPGGSS